MILTIDFETEPIDSAPDGRVPRPVGLAIKVDDEPAQYHAWGHPEGNNTARTTVERIMRHWVRRHPTILAHNIGFDAEVMRQHLDIDLSGCRWEDSQVLAFHDDPHSMTLKLKPLAERYLKEPPAEADAVRDWLVDAKIIRRGLKDFGAHICRAPAGIVGPYAIGDVERTHRLYKHFRALVDTPGYRRDIEATKVGLQMTRVGVPIDTESLAKASKLYEAKLARLLRSTAKLLDVPVFDPEDKVLLAERIESRLGINLPRTATGRRSTAKATILEALPDGVLKWHLLHISALNYDLKNFIRPWLFATQERTTIHPTWNVTRGDSGGARTGRLSSSPNFQNLRDVEAQERLREAIMVTGGAGAPPVALPMIRSFVKAPTGRTFVGRDWSQIELRITGHYEDGIIAQGYRDDPDFDLHQWVVDQVDGLFHKKLPRRIAKNIGFGSIYGAGANAIALQGGISVADAAEFRDMYFAALPTLKAFIRDVQSVSRARPIETLGGRSYKVEPPRMIDGEWRTFEYKMTNYLVQGSAADLMKEAMIQAAKAGLDLRLTVHDEAVVMCHTKEAKAAGDALRVAMEENDLIKSMTVPVTSNGYVCQRWSDAEK